jgi:hypothetical protein
MHALRSHAGAVLTGRSLQGKLVRTLEGHAHRVNHLALSTDYVLRSGPFDHTVEPIGTDLDAGAHAPCVVDSFLCRC